ncbi:MAG: UPF0182 family protein [Chloroflexota bacterium]
MSNNKDPFDDLIRSIEENLQKAHDDGEWQRSERNRDGGDGGRGDGGRGGGGGGFPGGGGNGEVPEINPRRFILFALPFLILISFNRSLSYYTDWLWYGSLDLSSVFWTRIFASFSLFLGGAIFVWLFIAVNVFIANRLMRTATSTPQRDTTFEQFADALGTRISTIVLIGAGIFAFLMGLQASANWEEVLLYFNHTNFNIVDPIFDQDVSFFVFTLPIWLTIRSWLLTIVFLTIVATVIVTGAGFRGEGEFRWQIRPSVLIHLSILGALMLLLFAWQYRLDAYQLVYSTRGAVFGAGYTDLNAQLPIYNILLFVTIVAAALLIATAVLRRGFRAIGGVIAVWIIISIVAGNIYPGLVQRFQVNPNELNLERPFIEDNIKFTRLAFDLDDIEVRDYDASVPLTAEALVKEPETVRNIRLWDYRPLLQTYNQVQALRQYYEFNDIDIDRYTIDGEVSQVMLSARELVPNRLNENAQTWVNRKLVYTHGYGVAASPVAQVTRDGLPEFMLKDLPPQGVITVTQPQIYFGEKAGGDEDYVIARTNEPEFDYPREEGNVTSSFEGNTGISMSFGARLLFALRFADINMLLNSDITADSQLLWRRNITERISEVAPFLAYDDDPYIVISDDGKLYWFLDAYTYSSRFPYSEPFNRAINYIRNPVKVVTSAYDGTMRFYITDPDEPIAAAYAKIFPALFSTMDEMPEDLLQHIRYPNDMFGIQSEVYRTYHMTDANEFYNKEDVWEWPQEVFMSESQRIQPYYVLMQLPDSDELDFIQILPFTPANRENMIAWLAAQNDPAKYGQKIVYQFGKDSLIFGPQQVEARIDQDPTISGQLSLWNQQGSTVIRGNLLVIPIGESLIYVEPLYLQAASGKIPELKRVILATVDNVVMAQNLGLALAELFGSDVLADAELTDLMTEGSPLPLSTGSATSDEGSSATVTNLTEATTEELIVHANTLYGQAQEQLTAGNWAGYGAYMDALQGTLEQLAAVSGVELAPAVEEEPAEEVPVEEVPADDSEADAEGAADEGAASE